MPVKRLNLSNLRDLELTQDEIVYQMIKQIGWTTM